ncbi:proton-conducting transporter membrane subunit [Methanosarcina sp. UBA5]|uniref:proton-conducting transporter transmembrane domain-containing protein n=1 Tax=Methanosarcina sp. UBA5 TaxID=1915593 RepID=UPI0025F3554D|nr:proton-conducting transporter membrane subunit [Methanosarcina sp. UBA5]
MIILNYLAVGAVAFALILLSKSHRAMNVFFILHTLAFLAIGFYALLTITAPGFETGSEYFYVDHLSLYEVLIAALLFFLASVYANGYVESLMQAQELHRNNLKIFYMVFSLLLTTVTLAFFSDNLALFWIFAELTTVFSAALVAILSARENIDAAIKYIFIASGAMLFSFIGLIFLYTLSGEVLGSGTLNWTLLLENAALLSPKMLTASFVFLFIGFAAKSGIFPFHTWLPDAHSKAPSAVSAILSGVLLNIGVYGILRMYSIVRQTQAEDMISQFLLGFGLLTVAVAVLNMLLQKNLKMLIAFSSVEHMGILLLGIGIGTPLALFWTLFYILAHSLTKAALFFSAGILHRQYESNLIQDVKDVFSLQPIAGWGFVIGSFAIVGMPPFPIFSAKFFILLEAFGFSKSLVFAVLLLLVIASAAFARFLIEAFTRSSKEAGTEGLETPPLPYVVRSGMKFPIISIIFMILVLGVFFPESLKNLLNEIVYELGYL